MNLTKEELQELMHFLHLSACGVKNINVNVKIAKLLFKYAIDEYFIQLNPEIYFENVIKKEDVGEMEFKGDHKGKEWIIWIVEIDSKYALLVREVRKEGAATLFCINDEVKISNNKVEVDVVKSKENGLDVMILCELMRIAFQGDSFYGYFGQIIGSVDAEDCECLAAELLKSLLPSSPTIWRSLNKFYSEEKKNYLISGYTNTSNQNEIEFLMDGEEFFPAFYKNLKEILEISNPDRYTYVRLACWSIGADLHLDNLAGEVKNQLGNMLSAVANQGTKVQILVWEGSYTAKRLMCDNSGFVNKMKEINKKVEIVSDRYIGNRFTGAYSAHQKIAIFSKKGKLTVLVGGFNFTNGYWDTKNHPCDKYQNIIFNGACHDTGIQIQGPATFDLEGIWIDRWMQSKEMKRSNIIRGRLKNQLISNTDQLVSITMATTDYSVESIKRQDILDLLLKSIDEAKEEILIEGFTLSSTSLVKKLAEKIKDSKVSVKIILPGQNITDTQVAGYYLCISIMKIIFYTCEGFKVGDEVFKRKDFKKWEIQFDSNDKYSSGDKIVVQKENENVEEFYFTKVTGFIGEENILFKPVRKVGENEKDIYIHSKLCIIDKEMLMIGSCNFNDRSMLYDLETSCFVSGNKNVVEGIHKKLMDHYDKGIKLVTVNSDTLIQRVSDGLSYHSYILQNDWA